MQCVCREFVLDLKVRLVNLGTDHMFLRHHSWCSKWFWESVIYAEIHKVTKDRYSESCIVHTIQLPFAHIQCETSAPSCAIYCTSCLQQSPGVSKDDQGNCPHLCYSPSSAGPLHHLGNHSYLRESEMSCVKNTGPSSSYDRLTCCFDQIGCD